MSDNNIAPETLVQSALAPPEYVQEFLDDRVHRAREISDILGLVKETSGGVASTGTPSKPRIASHRSWLNRWMAPTWRDSREGILCAPCSVRQGCAPSGNDRTDLPVLTPPACGAALWGPRLNASSRPSPGR